MKNSINWFEIPAKDFERATAFYSALFNVKIELMPHPNFKYGVLPGDYQNGGVGGAVVAGEGFEPSDKGPIIYLNGGDDLAGPLSKVETAGGKVLVPKTAIGENGYMAHFMDTEGNRLALHSPN